MAVVMILVLLGMLLAAVATVKTRRRAPQALPASDRQLPPPLTEARRGRPSTLRTVTRDVQNKLPAPTTDAVLRRGIDKTIRRSLTTLHSKVLPPKVLFEVHPDLYEQMAPAWLRLAAELSAEMDARAQAEGWETAGVIFFLRGNSMLGKWEIDVHPIYPDADDVTTAHAGGGVAPQVDNDDVPTALAEPQRVRRWLIELPGGSSRELPPGRSLTIGKSSTCDIQINNSPRVSRAHVRVLWTPTDDVVEIEDLNSTNGTTIDGQQLGRGCRTTVRSDSVIGLGAHDRIRLVYRAVQGNRR